MQATTDPARLCPASLPIPVWAKILAEAHLPAPLHAAEAVLACDATGIVRETPCLFLDELAYLVRVRPPPSLPLHLLQASCGSADKSAYTSLGLLRPYRGDEVL